MTFLRLHLIMIIGSVIIYVSVFTNSAVATDETTPLTQQWKIPIDYQATGSYVPQRAAILDFTWNKDDAAVLLQGNKFIAHVSWLGIGGQPHPIDVDANLYGISTASNGDFLVVGSKHKKYIGDYFSFSPIPALDAFIARINSVGEVIWQNNFGGKGFQVGSEVVELSNGNIVMAGSSYGKQWLWSLDRNGSLLWDHGLGVRGGNIVPLFSGGFAHIGTEIRGKDGLFVEDAKLWIMDNSGNILHSLMVREEINTSRGSHFLKASITANANSIAVSTAWPTPGLSGSKRLEIAKFSLAGDLLWIAVPLEQNCEAIPILEPDGDIVVACATAYKKGVSRHLVVTRYSAENGTPNSVSAALPSCQQGQTSAMIRIIRSDASETQLIGSRPPYNVGQSCTWLGAISAPPK